MKKTKARIEVPQKPNDIRYAWDYYPTLQELRTTKVAIETMLKSKDFDILAMIGSLDRFGLWLYTLKRKGRLIVVNRAATFVFGERVTGPIKTIAYRLAALASGLFDCSELSVLPSFEVQSVAAWNKFEAKHPLKALLKSIDVYIEQMETSLVAYNDEDSQL